MIWLKNYSWKKISTQTEMKDNGLKILNTDKLPDNFYLVYDIIKPLQRNTTMSEQVWKRILMPHIVADCKCDEIGYIAWNNKSLDLNINLENLLKEKGYWKFGFGLEKFSTPQKCFDYWINNDILYNGKYLKDLNELSIKVLDKKIENLNDLHSYGCFTAIDLFQFAKKEKKEITTRTIKT